MLEIDALELSVRATRALKKAGIGTIRKLYETTEDEILKLPNVGFGTLREIENARKNPLGWRYENTKKVFEETEKQIAALRKKRSALKRELEEWGVISELAGKL